MFQTAEATLRELAGPAIANALLSEPAAYAERLAAAETWLRGGDDRHVLAPGDDAYPPLLLQTADPPLLLYLQGRAELLSARGIAIVGSRQPSPQGQDNARAFARALAERGFTIVSGLALGIDAAAHEGALDAGAPTVAVMGTGPDRIYPARHRDLAHRIVAGGGALLSEHAPGTPALPDHFPQRNRLIAGLTQGTLVVEAALRSGSLITARLASEAGREVFAVPGSIRSPQAQGCHALIKQGAKLVEGIDDILEELQQGVPRQAALPMEDGASGGAPEPLLDALGHDPVTLDALLARTGFPVSELSARLLELELEGRVARLPGGLYQRRHTS